MLLLLTGASGVGKSTCRIAIAAALGDELDCVELRDVVAIPQAPDLEWRQRSVEAVVQRALSQDRDLLLAGDPVAPGELIAAPSADRLDGVAICLLDCDASSQIERLRRRGEPEELLARHVAFADWMREHARDPGHMPEVVTDNGWDAMRWERWADADWAFDVIDTSRRTPEDVAAAALAWVRAARAAPRHSGIGAPEARRPDGREAT